MPARRPQDPALADHLAWLGYVQPEGLVVSAPALVDAQAIIDRAQLGDLQRRFADHVTSLPVTESDTGDTQPGLQNLHRLLIEFLGWPPELLHGLDPARPLPPELTISLPEFGEVLAPTLAVLRVERVTLRPGDCGSLRPAGEDRETLRQGDFETSRSPAVSKSQSPQVSKSQHPPSQSPFLLLFQQHPATVDLDKPVASSERHWHASPSKKFERLLRETGVTIGLLTNGTHLRLIYAPPKENSGALTFPVGAMTEVSGRLILGAFQLLLGSWTLFTAPSEARLPALLQRSRDYQASVSEILAEQVLHALYELLRGLEAADERVQGTLLRELAARKPGDIYGGLVTVLLRLVFILFAEDRGLLPASGLYVRHYSVRGLFERLRADAERYPDTMDHRFGAWAQLLALFRVIYGGCRHPDLKMPARAGHLFDPDRYPFLEGRGKDRKTVRPGDGETVGLGDRETVGPGNAPGPHSATSHSPTVSKSQSHTVSKSQGLTVSKSQGLAVSKSQGLTVSKSQGLTVSKSQGLTVSKSQGLTVSKSQGLPLISDGTLHRILEKLCVLEGERVSYRTLDVEEIGSVYQTIMGFGVETAAGTAVALKGKRKNGGVPASPVISLEQLLALPAKDRAKWLKENADTELTGEADKRLKAAATVDDLHVALEKRIDRHATPAPVAQGGLVLQPTDERRRSGSHYTPRSFTEPIVRKTLQPILERLTLGLGDSETLRPSQSPKVSQSQSPPTAPPRPEDILNLKIADIAVGSAAFLVETCRQLADVLVKSWRVHGGRPALPPDETEELFAMRTIAQCCLYGVDRNPMAVDLAKLSLWLATLAKDHPFTFLDHAIRCGDSLVGLTRRQIETFTWKTEFTTGQLWEQEVRKRTAAALRERQSLLSLGDDYVSPQLKREKLEKADELLDLVRFIGDAAVAAFFSADKDKAREAKRAELAERIAGFLSKGDMRLRPTAEVKNLKGDRETLGQRSRGDFGTLGQGDFETAAAASSQSLTVARSQSHALKGDRETVGQGDFGTAAVASSQSLTVAPSHSPTVPKSQSHPCKGDRETLGHGDFETAAAASSQSLTVARSQSHALKGDRETLGLGDIETGAPSHGPTVSKSQSHPLRGDRGTLGQGDFGTAATASSQSLTVAPSHSPTVPKSQSHPCKGDRETLGHGDFETAAAASSQSLTVARSQSPALRGDRETLGQGDFGTAATASSQSLTVAPSHSPTVPKSQSHPVLPFHWEIEFPEVFDRENPGFDGIVGNPPFAGKNTLIKGNRRGYLDWLMASHPEANGASDLVAHFFRSGFCLLRSRGTLGLIATNTIGQGDTRVAGLRWICVQGGTIYSAQRRFKWPGQAAVIVSVVWLHRGHLPGPFELDGRLVDQITAFLFHTGGNENPPTLRANERKAFKGCEIGSLGFLLAPTAVEVPELNGLRDPRNNRFPLLKPYFGGEDLNASAVLQAPRLVLDVDGLDLSALRQLPQVLALLDQRVRPDLLDRGEISEGTEEWWHFRRPSIELRETSARLPRLLCVARVSQTCAFAFLPNSVIANEKIILFPFESYDAFALLQSKLHELWARLFSSTLKDDLQYTPSDCFETFPFPAGFETNAAPALGDRETVRQGDFGTSAVPQSQSLKVPKSEGPSVSKSQSPTVAPREDRETVRTGDSETSAVPQSHSLKVPKSPFAALEEVGRTYYEYRAALMQDLWLGLTEIYNLFHSPDDEALARLEALYRKRAATPDWRIVEKVPAERTPLTLYPTPAAALAGVQRLRELHAAMDTAVLTAYGWEDLLPKCTCEFLLDYEDEEDSETVGPCDGGTGSGSQGLPVSKSQSLFPSPSVSKSQSRRKKPWRYRWPDEVRDEVLARLLKLNAERAEEERLVGLAAAAAAPGSKGAGGKGKKPRSAKAVAPAQSKVSPPPQRDFFE